MVSHRLRLSGHLFPLSGSVVTALRRGGFLLIYPLDSKTLVSLWAIDFCLILWDYEEKFERANTIKRRIFLNVEVFNWS